MLWPPAVEASTPSAALCSLQRAACALIHRRRGPWAGVLRRRRGTRLPRGSGGGEGEQGWDVAGQGVEICG